MSVRAYEVWCVEFPEFPATVVNATSAGRAKRDRHLSISDAWPEVPYTSMRARVAGAPQSSADFLRCAANRGRPEVRCGDKVRVRDSTGTIVGHNSSANWNVLFHDGEYAGLRLNVHPESCEVLPPATLTPGGNEGEVRR